MQCNFFFCDVLFYFIYMFSSAVEWCHMSVVTKGWTCSDWLLISNFFFFYESLLPQFYRGHWGILLLKLQAVLSVWCHLRFLFLSIFIFFSLSLCGPSLTKINPTYTLTYVSFLMLNFLPFKFDRLLALQFISICQGNLFSW